ncbi:MAG: translation initiation factor IF-3 [bacterium]
MRVNSQIRISPVRLIGPEGEQLGIVPVKEALEKAQIHDLDLVEVSPTSRPPVCRILDFGKFKYEQARKEKQAKKRQHSFQLKEMRYRPKIDEHDYQFKLRHVREFLTSGSKVRTFVMFRGRELAYTDQGKELLERVAQDMSDIANVDMPPKREGRHMSMILGPKPEIMKALKNAPLKKPNRPDREEELVDEAVELDEETADVGAEYKDEE